MVERIETATVKLWGDRAGAVSWHPNGYGVFEYDPEFVQRGLDLSPVVMSIYSGSRLFSFPGLSRETYRGLPGLLADSLPDKFGNAIIDAWLARQGRTPGDFSPIERLCYTGHRGMGALEFEPAVDGRFRESAPVEIAELVKLAQSVTHRQEHLASRLGADDSGNAGALADILRVGTSAGGARAKAVIAMNAAGDVRSGQVPAPAGYDYWLLKFDGVDDIELGESQGFGRIEYAYYQMAQAAGVGMMESRLLEENGRAHFMTRRFDRVDGDKLHMLSLCGIAHLDFNQAGAHSYEQAFAVMRELGLPKSEAIQQYRRLVFNVLARNQDDHTKNIAFLMDRGGEWSLSPAFDLTYAHNPGGRWTNQHQMSINGKRDQFTLEDLVAVAESISIKKPRDIIEEVAAAVARWPEFAERAGVKESFVRQIAENHRQLL
ncbi:type II toxin-antitoxin system HipA family toxin [Microbulbifer rhizosphaerae]|uniref:Serine/threonine-protein kinase HipA n=1 Tax=Microbulbifer rhizosphaerae TaxID=1562603 RepID=A0A7W4W8L6_9GAMM|nr:type II toxin-antitoxin system HipA family toxin [Microbulbifer rhizosphaerae]MBB3059484.1 serine/threonine-protein kinase HipA [Microbulbifer rhizosphaerae]